MTEEDKPSQLEEKVKELEKILTAKEKICQVLTKRVVRSIDSVGGAYSIFERNILLQNMVDQRSREIEEANKKLAREINERIAAQKEREKLITELQQALSKVKTLSGLLPICASCKKIRDDKGYWNQIESYIKDRSEAEFSHGICPECIKMLYPEVHEKKLMNKKG